MNALRDFWAVQTSSLPKTDTSTFYANKAIEHSLVISPEDRLGPIADLGCGAGELLLHLANHLNITVGIDYSESMLRRLGERLGKTTIRLIPEDVTNVLPQLDCRVWISCCAVNQYMTDIEMRELLNQFIVNSHAQSIYFFDCVDPLRYFTLSPWSHYECSGRKFPSVKSRASTIVHLLRYIWKLIVCPRANRHIPLRRKGMGYGYLPPFWIEACAQLGLSCEIISSRFYEYRYHVLIKKPCAQ